MKRLATLIGGAVAGVLLTGAFLYAVAWLWPGLAAPGATPTATAVAGVTEADTPADTPAPTEAAAPTRLSLPTEESPFLQELVLPATPTRATSAAPRTGGGVLLPITRLSLQRPYEAQGFDFQYARLGDSRERWVAASPDGLALVEIAGAEAVEHASVTVFGPIRRDAPDAAKRAIYMLTMMTAILPGWAEGAEWFGGELVNAARQPGDYVSAVTHNRVRIEFSVDVSVGSITLSFDPE